jgi:hypothetical protein
MKKQRTKIPTNLALDKPVLDRVSAWIAAQDMPVTKTWVFERALSEFLEKRGA